MTALPEWITWRQRPGSIIEVDQMPVDMSLLKKLDRTTEALAIAWEALELITTEKAPAHAMRAHCKITLRRIEKLGEE